MTSLKCYEYEVMAILRFLVRRRRGMYKAIGCVIRSRFTTLLLVVVLIYFMTGCATFKKKEEVNLEPFAEQTITMAGSVNYGFMSVRPVYTRQYIEQTPEVVELRSMTLKIRGLMRGIVAYSIQVVTLSQASKTGPEQAQGLADFIEELLKPVVEQRNVDLRYEEGKVAETVENIRQQETLLDALRVAQPLVDEVARVADAFLDQYLAQQVKTIDALDQAVDVEFAPILEYERFLRENQAYVLTNLELLYEYWKGDETALETLRQREVPALSKMNLADGMTRRELREAEDILIARMARITELRKNIEPQMTLYATQKRELQDLNFEMGQTLSRTRAAITIWQRTHRAMAAGLIYPADINLFEVTKKIVEVALPF
jgi:hypothetical protein